LHYAFNGYLFFILQSVEDKDAVANLLASLDFATFKCEDFGWLGWIRIFQRIFRNSFYTHVAFSLYRNYGCFVDGDRMAFAQAEGNIGKHSRFDFTRRMVG